jgi:LDH2 family malate/lactate/ureidoglycolate dehydrogenase
MVELLTGALMGAGLSDEVRSMYLDLENGGNNGHLFLAFDVGRWTEPSTFYERTAAFLTRVEASGGNRVGKPVRIPGRARWEARDRSDAGGIVIEGHVRAELETAAAHLGVPVAW